LKEKRDSGNPEKAGRYVAEIAAALSRQMQPYIHKRSDHAD
jgi:hypothetical protein